MRFPLFVVALLGLPFAAPAAVRTNFDADWSFARFGPQPDGSSIAEPPALEAPALDDQSWRKVDLPHDWGIEGPFRADLPNSTGKLPWAGIGWYRKHFPAPALPSGGHLYLDIDGAMARPKVWLNGEFVGEWAYGYTSFRLDLTAHLKPGTNVLAIRLDNPPESSRWYPGGGLYRDVWLVTTAAVALDHWGVFIHTPEVSAKSATVAIAATVRNDTSRPVRATVRHHLADPSGREVAVVAGDPLDLGPGATGRVETSAHLTSPQRWDIDSPRLYTCRTEVDLDGAITDTETLRFGIRSTRWSATEGFFLNGRRVPLQGVCLHHDLGALGTAFNLSAARRQLTILRDMGCNAIRTAHNPPAPGLLDLCDELGLLVMDELFDTWKLRKTPNDYSLFFDAWHDRDVANFVRRDRNHPSVILWSSGNEIPELKGGPASLARSRELTALFHREDPTRPVTGAMNHPSAMTNGMAATLDVAGYNYKAIGNHQVDYRDHFAHNPDQPVFGSETASTVSSRGEYFFPVSDRKDGGFFHFQVSSYDLYAPSWACRPDLDFNSLDRFPRIAGEFVWTGFDYLGEPTPYNNDATNSLNFADDRERRRVMAQLDNLGGKAPSRSSYFGILDLAGLPKDRFYLYQARWRPDLPMAHILPHWTWPGREGELTPVQVYTSGDEAELFLNGKSLGRQRRAPGQYRFRWDQVHYQPGELKVATWRAGQPWAGASVRTTGAPVHLELTPDPHTTALVAGRPDLVYLRLTARDARGDIAPRADLPFAVMVEGAARFVAADNGDATDLRTFSSPVRSLFNGQAIVILAARDLHPGPATVRVESPGLPPATLTLEVGSP